MQTLFFLILHTYLPMDNNTTGITFISTIYGTNVQIQTKHVYNGPTSTTV